MAHGLPSQRHCRSLASFRRLLCLLIIRSALLAASQRGPQFLPLVHHLKLAHLVGQLQVLHVALEQRPVVGIRLVVPAIQNFHWLAEEVVQIYAVEVAILVVELQPSAVERYEPEVEAVLALADAREALQPSLVVPAVDVYRPVAYPRS